MHTILKHTSLIKTYRTRRNFFSESSSAPTSRGLPELAHEAVKLPRDATTGLGGFEQFSRKKLKSEQKFDEDSALALESLYILSSWGRKTLSLFAEWYKLRFLPNKLYTSTACCVSSWAELGK